jgi:hypothetical protein
MNHPAGGNRGGVLQLSRNAKDRLPIWCKCIMPGDAGTRSLHGKL